VIVLPVVLACLATLVAGYLAWWEYRRTQQLFTPWMLFLIYGALDIFLPAAVFLVTNPPSLTDWIVPLRKDEIASSTLVYVASLSLFAAGYFFASGRADPGGTDASDEEVSLKVKIGYVYVGLVVSASWYLLHQFIQVQQAGSFDAYLADKFRERFRPDIFTTKGPVDFIFNQFAPSMLPIFLVLVGILFFFRHRHGRSVLWGWILPAIAWTLTLTTFYRGYQLNFFLSLAFIETCRLRAAKRHPELGLERTGQTRERSLMAPRTKVLAAIAVLVFLLYGAYRQYNSSFQYGDPVSIGEAVTDQGGELVRGWGVVGLSSILSAYPESDSRLGGSSIATTFFMPIPRPLWPGKPERYGAEEVTRRMGWPSTTQSAITMPGELYANFGLLGIPLVAAFGFAFRALYRRRHHPKLLFVYAFFVPHSVLLTHWMSSTGLMTSVTLYALSVVAVVLVLAVGKENGSREPALNGSLHVVPTVLHPVGNGPVRPPVRRPAGAGPRSVR
jgi:hypothetical protein